MHLIKSLKTTLDIVNSKLQQHEILKKIIVLDEVWTVENKLLTPTMKIKRNLIENKFKEFYQEWYGNEDPIVFN